ncbi:MAG: oligosaccharide flippase family protein [Clostridia bacterium]|nr:oligosaccharide flippase family protein [Clostridia bacterium]
MADNSKYKRLISNTAMIAVGSFGSKILKYLLVRFYTELLSTDQYGLAENLTEMAILLIPVISLGIADAVHRFLMDSSYSQKDVFSSGIVSWLIGSLILAIVIPVLSSINYFHDYVWLIVLYISASIFHSLCSQFAISLNKFGLGAVAGITNTLTMLLCNILFLLPLNMGVTGYVLSVIVADFISALVLIFALRLWRYVDLSSVQKETLKKMLRFSIPLIPTAIFWWIINVSDKFMVTAFISESANGIYSAAYKIPSLIMFVSGIFLAAWKNSAISEFGNEETGKFYSNVFKTSSGMYFMVSSVLIAGTPILVRLLFSDEYQSAWVYVPILTAAMVFYNCSSFFGSIYTVVKKSSYSLYTSLIGAVLNVALNYILLVTYRDAYGAAIATLVCYVAVFVIRAISVRKFIDFDTSPLKTFLNSVLIIAQVAVVTLRPKFWFVGGILFALVIIALNVKPFIILALNILKKLAARRRHSA